MKMLRGASKETKLLAMAVIAAELDMLTKGKKRMLGENAWFKKIAEKLGRKLTDDDEAWVFSNYEELLENFVHIEW